LRIFVSYPSEQARFAEEVAQALKNVGHDVFFDKESLPPAEDYNERIRDAILKADRCIFIIDKSALAPGKYVLTELEFAKARWPSAAGKVFAVIVDPDFPRADLPPYLKMVQAFAPKGNATAEVAAVIERSRSVSGLCWLCILTALIFFLCSIFLVAGNFGAFPRTSAEISLFPIEKVHFRPRAAPPADLLSPSAPVDWVDSPLTITIMSVAYDRRDDGVASARLIGESAELRLTNNFYRFDWSYLVEILNSPCADWLCVKSNVTVETLDRGRATRSRETMFLPTSDQPLTWKTFIDQVLGSETLSEITVVLRSAVEVSLPGRTNHKLLAGECLIDVSSARANFLAKGFRFARDPRPAFWQPVCVKRRPGV
jgi:hypothetical protein